MSHIHPQTAQQSQFGPLEELSSEQLHDMIERIGLARFVGRINSGLIAAEVGYEAIEQYMEKREARPLVSRIAHAALSRRDPYDHKP